MNESEVIIPIRRFISEIEAGNLISDLSELKERMTIIIQKNYIIEKKTVLMMGEYNRYGKLCTRVMAGSSSFLVDRTPLQLLDDTLISIGYNLRGAMSGAKSILGKKMKCPIIVNPYQGICLFPSKSPNKVDCIWFNPEQILKTSPMGDKTNVELRNGCSIIVDSKCLFFNNKIQAADQLLKISMETGHHPTPIIFYLEPKKNVQLSKEETGKYNFDVLEEEQD